MQEIELLNPTRIIRSTRKTLALEITKDNKLLVRAPLRVGLDQINRFIVEKADWIIKKRLENLNRVPTENSSLKFGDTVSILGEEIILTAGEGKRVKKENNLLFLPTDFKDALAMYLKKELKKYLEIRVNYFASLYNFNYKSISISSARTNWGSCSYNNALHFTYRLALCPLNVIDYIIVHELAHTKIKNHSRQFYLLVSRIMPNYKIANQYLKEHRELKDLV